LLPVLSEILKPVSLEAGFSFWQKQSISNRQDQGAFLDFKIILCLLAALIFARVSRRSTAA
jgi:hypothetical protein